MEKSALIRAVKQSISAIFNYTEAGASGTAADLGQRGA
jgi:hypothetical protein